MCSGYFLSPLPLAVGRGIHKKSRIYRTDGWLMNWMCFVFCCCFALCFISGFIPLLLCCFFLDAVLLRFWVPNYANALWKGDAASNLLQCRIIPRCRNLQRSVNHSVIVHAAPKVLKPFLNECVDINWILIGCLSGFHLAPGCNLSRNLMCYLFIFFGGGTVCHRGCVIKLRPKTNNTLYQLNKMFETF